MLVAEPPCRHRFECQLLSIRFSQSLSPAPSGAGFVLGSFFRSLWMRDEVPDHRDGAFRRIGDHGVPAIRKSFELHEMRRDRRRNVSLAFYRYHRIVLTSEHEGRALDAAKIREHIERVALAARSCEPMLDL